MRTKIQMKADAAHTTLLAYKTYSGSETQDVEANTRTLLTDLMHLSEDYNFTVEDLVREARVEYNKDKEAES